MCIKFPAALVGSAETGVGSAPASTLSRIKRTGHPGPAKRSGQHSTNEVPSERPALREILAFALGTGLAGLGFRPMSRYVQGLGASRHFRCPPSRGPTPGRSALENLGPIGRLSAGGPIAERQRGSSSFATVRDALDPCSLFVIPRGGAHLSDIFPGGGRRAAKGTSWEIPGGTGVRD